MRPAGSGLEMPSDLNLANPLAPGSQRWHTTCTWKLKSLVPITSAAQGSVLVMTNPVSTVWLRARRADHGRVPDGDGQPDGALLGHSGDNKCSIEEPVPMALGETGMAVVVRRGIGHGDVLQRERHCSRLVYFQLIEGNQLS